jgi:hypothetical protein
MSCGIDWVRWHYNVMPCGIDWVRWPYYGLPRGTVVGPTCQVTCAWVGPTCWRGPMGGCHVAPGCWNGPIWCCHVAHPLPSSVLYFFCSQHPVCTQDCCCPQVAPRVPLIKSQPLINPFNLSCLLWIYFNSSTYPKIMKFSPKNP